MLQSAELPLLAEIITINAFENTVLLKEIEFPDTIWKIQEGAFCNTGLVSVTLPDGPKELEDYTFYGCNSLKEMIIPDTCTQLISFWAVCKNCPVLEHVYTGRRSIGTVHGSPGSTAEAYALEHGVNFVPLTEDDITP